MGAPWRRALGGDAQDVVAQIIRKPARGVFRRRPVTVPPQGTTNNPSSISVW
jgi:hypothetical protein